MKTYIKRTKVHQSHNLYKLQDAGRYLANSPEPWIRLRGRWLEKAGFAIGAPVVIEVSMGRLVLTVEKASC